MEKYWGTDPLTVVIDEYLAPASEQIWLFAIIAFALFRIIDIFKPSVCRWVDQHVKGGLGVMFDDVLAGFYALVLLLIIKSIF